MALLRAGGVGLSIIVVVRIILSGILALAPDTGLLPSIASRTDDPDQAMLAIVVGLPILIFVAIVLFYAGLGATYSWFVKKSDNPLNIGLMALGGALVAYIIGVLGGIVDAVIASDVALGLFTVCVYPFIFAVLGAVGAAIYAAAMSNRPKPQPEEM